MQRASWNLSAVLMGGLLAVSVGNTPRAQEPKKPGEISVLGVWPAGPLEARVDFDRPVSEELAKSMVGKTIAYHETGDKQGVLFINHHLNIAAARLENGNQTLILTTDPPPLDTNYRFDLPEGQVWPTGMIYILTGVEASWSGEGKAAWKGWWPDLDPDTVRAKLSASPEYARLLTLLQSRGKLTLETLLTMPKGPFTLILNTPARIEATLNGEPSRIENHAAVSQTESTGDPMLLSVTLTTGPSKSPFSFKATAKPANGRELPVGRDFGDQGTRLGRLLLPWSPSPPAPPAPLENVPDLSGGDPREGAIVFASADAKCATCHKVRGEGGSIGPDLSELVGRDPKEVYRDIAEPGARINPEFVSYTVALNDGRILVGTVRAEGADAIRIVDTDAKVTIVPRARIEEFRPASASVMPVGLPGVIGEKKLRDLIAFLTTRQDGK